MEIVPIDNWFPTLVYECSQIIEKAKVRAGMVFIEAKYEMGKRILIDYEKFGSYEGGKTQADLAYELGFSQKTISDCIRFAERIKLEYKDSFEKFSNTVTKPSWRKIALEWLPKRIRYTKKPSPLEMIASEAEKLVYACDDKILHLLQRTPPCFLEEVIK